MKVILEFAKNEATRLTTFGPPNTELYILEWPGYYYVVLTVIIVFVPVILVLNTERESTEHDFRILSRVTWDFYYDQRKEQGNPRVDLRGALYGGPRMYIYDRNQVSFDRASSIGIVNAQVSIVSRSYGIAPPPGMAAIHNGIWRDIPRNNHWVILTFFTGVYMAAAHRIDVDGQAPYIVEQNRQFTRIRIPIDWTPNPSTRP